MSKISIKVSSSIFSYEELKAKAFREIKRLEKAEIGMEEHVIDHALNAAFTVYHLLQWKNKTANPNSNTKEHELCEKSQNDALKMLHAIVTCNKHVTVTNAHYKKDFEVKVSAADVSYFVTEDGNDYLTTEDGNRFVTEDSRFVIKFDDKKALDVLNEAMTEFD
jgi:hypothetical protein